MASQDINDDDEVIVDTDVQEEDDSSEDDQIASPMRFDISSYGWDVDVEGLVKRMNRKDIHVPGFQRGFVWNGPDKSRFIESLILGLPVPTLFLARDSDSKDLNIIDGQQRLKTLQSYMNGDFSLSGKDMPDDLKGCYHSNRRSPHGERKAYPRAKILSQADERTLSDAVVHAIVIKPNPKDDDVQLGHEYNKAIIQIFKRLNTTGKALNAQEVRASIFHGPLLSLIQNLNDMAEWRALFGKAHGRMKDQEVILRALALYSIGSEYKSPMPKFLDGYMEDNRHISDVDVERLSSRFILAVKLIRQSLGDSAFKTRGTFVTTRFDALIVALMGALRDEDLTVEGDIEEAFRAKMGERTVKVRLAELEADNRGLDGEGNEIEDLPTDQRGYNWSVAKFTNDTNRVEARLSTAKAAFTIT